MNNTLKILNRGDRLGNNLIGHILQIIFGEKNNFFIETIKVSNDNKSGANIHNSLFVDILNHLILNLNSNKVKTLNIIDIIDKNDEYYIQNGIFSIKKLSMKICILLKQDILSYFKNNYFELTNIYLNNCASNKYNFKINYDWNKIICLHLRLDDVYFNSKTKGINNRFEYNGKYSSDFYINKINNDINNYSENEKILYLKNNIPESEQKNNPNLDFYDTQAPINKNILLSIINKLKLENPYHKVMIVASPNGKVEIESDFLIRSKDENYDLFCMIHSDILVCSKSMFSLCGAIFHKGTKIFIPMWGHFASLGLMSKYDKNKNIEYFY